MSSLLTLPPDSLGEILRCLSYREAIAIQGVCRWGRDIGRADAVWREHVRRDWGEEIGEGAYRRWREIMGRYHGCGRVEDVIRGHKASARIGGWTRREVPEVASSLREGVTEDTMRAYIHVLGGDVHPLVKLMWKLCDGQVEEIPGQEDLADGFLYQGVFGGYSHYHTLVSMRMWGMERAVHYSEVMRRRLGTRFTRLEGKLIFSASYRSERAMFADLRSARLLVNVGPLDEFNLVPVCPSTDFTVLDWLDAFADRLVSGVFLAQPLIPSIPSSVGICLFPQAGPTCTFRVTGYIKIQTSVLFLPEISEHDGSFSTYAYTYSISMSLTPDAPPDTVVQLLSRHWLIEEFINGEYHVVDEVRGRGVIGAYPVLRVGQEPFTYQSVTTSSSPRGRMGGDMTFVKGGITEASINDPSMIIRTAVEYFPLEMPFIIF